MLRCSKTVGSEYCEKKHCYAGKKVVDARKESETVRCRQWVKRPAGRKVCKNCETCDAPRVKKEKV